MKPWSIVLIVLFIIDSIYTAYLGTELNALYIWIMNTFNISLNMMMIYRVFYVLPLIWVIDRYYKPEYILTAYVFIYFYGLQIQNTIERVMYG